MNSLTFRERFKDKLEKIQRDGSFKIKENYAILKESLPPDKYHQLYRSEAISNKYGKASKAKLQKSIERLDSLNYETLGNIPIKSKLVRFKSESSLNHYTQHSSQDHKKPDSVLFQRKKHFLPSLIPKLSLNLNYPSRPGPELPRN